MKYTKDNLVGFEFNILGTSFYKIKFEREKFYVYSGKPFYSNNCGLFSLKDIVFQLKRGHWKPTNSLENIIYEIY